MPINDKDLRQTLLRKLRGGDRRFVHLNATTARSRQKIDFTCLASIKDGLDRDFIESLTGVGNLSFRIPLKDIDQQILNFTNTKKELPEEEKNELLQKLQNLSVTKKSLEFLEAHQKEEFSELGTKSLAFGYPLLLKQVGGERDDVICAPLFLWYLDIDRDYQSDTLVLSRSEESPILFNEMLDYYMESELHLDFRDTVEQINARISDDGILDMSEVQESVGDITAKLSSAFAKPDFEILQKVPKDRKAVAKILEKSGDTEVILNAGIFGIFRAGKQSIINDLKNLIEQDEPGSIENLDIEIEQDYPFSVINTDPTQEHVIESVKKSQNLIIQGPPGTGKSQTLTALITNALANGQRALVVCEKRTAMEIIKRNLEDIGLGDYIALVENINRDRTVIVDRARDINESKHQPHYSVRTEFESARRLNESSAFQIARHHDAIAALTKQYGGPEGYGQNDIKYFLGKYLKLSKLVDDETLFKCGADFSKIPFSFTSVEFSALVNELDEARGECVTLQTNLNLIPAKEIALTTYQQDRVTLEMYFKTKQNDIAKLGKCVGGLRDLAIESKHAELRMQLDEAKKLAGEALPLLEVNSEDYNWRKIEPRLNKSLFLNEVTNKAVIKTLENIRDSQNELDRYIEVTKSTHHETSAKVEQLKELLVRITKDLETLHTLGVDSPSSRISDAALSTFSKKRKEIKNHKDNIQRAVLSANRISTSLANIVALPRISLEAIQAAELRNAINSLPSSKVLVEAIIGMNTSLLMGETLLDSAFASKSVREYSHYLVQNSRQGYEELKAAISIFYSSKIQSLLVEHFRVELHLEDIDDTVSGCIKALQKIQSHTIDEASLTSFVANTIDHSKTNVVTGLDDALSDINTLLMDDLAYSNALNPLCIDIDPANTVLEIIMAIGQVTSAISGILNELEAMFYQYYRWCESYLAFAPTTQRVIALFDQNGINEKDWQTLAQALYCHKLVTMADTPSLLNSDTAIERFMSSSTNIKALLIDTIKIRWAGNRLISIGSFESGLLRFNSLYNKRGSKGQRRNSLRKIIERDFRLFTSLFPVVICNPGSAASLFPLKKDLFDLVLFDEASQLRLEDTYTSLYRGRIKIISGDQHQMPPSSYFQSELDDNEEAGEDDESLQISEITSAESLLDYADINGYKSEMLKIHYRSDHADLIQFSNYAFYDAKLSPIPKFETYIPIEYNRINGTYKERQNEAEADYVVQWLKSHSENHKPLRSVGVATLNIPQAELIKEKIADERTASEAFNTFMTKLDELGFFVKNLENIQGDERDIIILSTTFGNDSEGKFRQNFGPLNNSNGYRLLNVLVTRAKHNLIIATSIPDNNINRYQDELVISGKDKRAIFYTYLAYARAVAESDEATKRHILDLLNNADKEVISDNGGQTESPFEEEVLEVLEQAFDPKRIRLQYQVGGENFRIDIMILNKDCTVPMLAIECDGYAYHSSPQAYLYDSYRREILKNKGGFDFYPIWSTNWFHDQRNEESKLIATVREYDGRN